MLGNLVPLHNPLRIAEELAMADCLSRGRILSGFARGVPREYNVYGVSMGESRARFEEAVDIILKAWTEPKFSYEGKFWSYKDIAIWPRPYQQPHPPVWVPFTGSKETIEWAGKHNFSAVIPDHHRGLTQDIVGYFAKQLAANGHTHHAGAHLLLHRRLCGDDQATAIKEYSPFYLYFVHTLWHHGSLEKEVVAEGHRLPVVVVVRLHQAGEPRRRGRRPRGHDEDDAGRHREQDRRRASWPGARQGRHRAS